MGLSERQSVLARLLTDAVLCARFRSDPAAVGQELALTPDDTAQLACFVMPDVERSARSLCAKRWNEIEKLLPLSVAAADHARVPLRRWFMQFAQTGTPQGNRRHVQDALAFADWFAQRFAEGRHESRDTTFPWLSDLLRYEAAWLAANLDTRSRFVLFKRFRFPMHRLAHALAQNAFETLTTVNMPARKFLYGWLRLSLSGKVRHVVLPLP